VSCALGSVIFIVSSRTSCICDVAPQVLIMKQQSSTFDDVTETHRKENNSSVSE
jgi:hypothetical protein